MTENNEIYGLCFCSNFRFEELKQHFLTNHAGTEYKNVLNVLWQQGDAFIFDYGVIVFWHMTDNNRSLLLDELKPFAENPLTDVIDDEFSFVPSTENPSIKNDQIFLPFHDVMIRLAISHGIAQSTKLAQFEYQVQQTINDTAYIPRSIAETGKTSLSRNDLSKLRGRLFISTSDIMLNYDLLDVPDFFWEYPEVDNYYILVSDYLEIKQRVEVLSKKLETIHELFDMMADEQKHKHSSLLEWIIIWLIAFEIVVFLIHDIFKLF